MKLNIRCAWREYRSDVIQVKGISLCLVCLFLEQESQESFTVWKMGDKKNGSNSIKYNNMERQVKALGR